MKTEVKLCVNDELFDNAVTEILKAKITELVRNSAQTLFNDELINKLTKSALNSTVDKYFSSYNGTYYATSNMREIVEASVIRTTKDALSEYVNSDDMKNIINELISRAVAFYADKYLHDDIANIIKEMFISEIRHVAADKFESMLATTVENNQKEKA